MTTVFSFKNGDIITMKDDFTKENLQGGQEGDRTTNYVRLVNRDDQNPQSTIEFQMHKIANTDNCFYLQAGSNPRTSNNSRPFLKYDSDAANITWDSHNPVDRPEEIQDKTPYQFKFILADSTPTPELWNLQACDGQHVLKSSGVDGRTLSFLTPDDTSAETMQFQVTIVRDAPARANTDSTGTSSPSSPRSRNKAQLGAMIFFGIVIAILLVMSLVKWWRMHRAKKHESSSTSTSEPAAQLGGNYDEDEEYDSEDEQ